MKKQTSFLRASSAIVAASLLVPFASGCGSPTPPAPTQGGGTMMQRQPAANTGMTTKQKVVMLAGAAALYYYYNRSKKANEAKLRGQNIQYYLSKSTGRVYYRDPANPKQAIWVTPPPNQAQQVQVPANEASQYSGFRGYNNSTSGYGLEEKFPVQ